MPIILAKDIINEKLDGKNKHLLSSEETTQMTSLLMREDIEHLTIEDLLKDLKKKDQSSDILRLINNLESAQKKFVERESQQQAVPTAQPQPPAAPHAQPQQTGHSQPQKQAQKQAQQQAQQPAPQPAPPGSDDEEEQVPNTPSGVAANVNPELLKRLEEISKKCNPQQDDEKGTIYSNLTDQDKAEFKKVLDEIRKTSCDIKNGANGVKEHTENGKVIFTEEKTASGKIKFTPGVDSNGNIDLDGERIITVPHVTEQNGKKVETGGYDVLKYSTDGKLVDCKRVGDVSHSQLDPDWLKGELQKSQGMGLSASVQRQASQAGSALNRSGMMQTPNSSSSSKPTPSHTPNHQNLGSGASFSVK